MRRLLAPLTVLALLLPLAPAVATEPAVDEVIVAILDTGIDADHPEFAPGQVVAWWDFTASRKPAERTDPFAQGAPLWDTDIPSPYDDHGHGTAVASALGGRNVGDCGDVPKESHAPGVKLVIAKVGMADGTIPADLASAWRWAVEVAGADIVSGSFSYHVPGTANTPEVLAQIRSARENGTLTLVAAGNGLFGIGGAPFPSWSAEYGSSPDVVVVGGGSRDGNDLLYTWGNLDPDVSAWGDDVCLAAANTGGYIVEGGTSFATPLVAGMAASAIRAARENGVLASPDAIEDLLHGCARDTVAPFAREGWGFLGAPEVPCILQNAAAGTRPQHQSYLGLPLDENELYDQTARETFREVFSSPELAESVIAARRVVADVTEPLPSVDPGEIATPFARTPVPTLTGPGELGMGMSPGVFEVEAYYVDLPAGARFVATLAPSDDAYPLNDIDLLVYPRAAYESGILLSSVRLAGSTNAWEEPELIDWTAPEAMQVVVLAVGFTMVFPGEYTLTTSHAAAFGGQAMYAGTTFAL